MMLPFILAFACALAITPVVRRLSRKWGIVAHPRNDRWHRTAVPMLGGIAIFVATGVGYLAGGREPDVSPSVLIAGISMFGLGLLDDFIGLKPNTKLIGQIVVACIAIFSGLRLGWTSIDVVDNVLTIFWVIGVTNAFNLLDNMDGLCAGIAAITAIALSSNSLSAPDAVYALCIAGAVLGFLVFNFNPASIFMGDSGSLFLGSSLAVLALSIESQARPNMSAALAPPVLIMLIPIFDTILVTLTRTLSARSAAVGGRDHTSHRLVALGLTERQAVLVLYVLAAASASIAWIVGRIRPTDAHVLIALMILLVVLLGVHLARVRVYEGQDFRLLERSPLTPLVVGFMYKRRVFEVLLDLGLITLAYYLAYSIRFNEDLPTFQPQFLRSLPVVTACQLLSFFVVGVYRGMWRYISVSDLATYLKGVALGTGASVIALLYLYRFDLYSRGVFIIDMMALLLLVVGSRLSFRTIGEFVSHNRRRARRAVVYGAGDAGMLLIRELRNNPNYDCDPICLIDDDVFKSEKRILGVPVIGTLDRLEQVLAEKKIDVVIVSTDKLGAKKVATVQEICSKHNAQLLRMHFRIETVGADEPPARAGASSIRRLS